MGGCVRCPGPRRHARLSCRRCGLPPASAERSRRLVPRSRRGAGLVRATQAPPRCVPDRSSRDAHVRRGSIGRLGRIGIGRARRHRAVLGVRRIDARLPVPGGARHDRVPRPDLVGASGGWSDPDGPIGALQAPSSRLWTARPSWPSSTRSLRSAVHAMRWRNLNAPAARAGWLPEPAAPMSGLPIFGGRVTPRRW